MWPEIVMDRKVSSMRMTRVCLAFEVLHECVEWPTSVRPLVGGEDCSHPHFVLGWSGGVLASKSTQVTRPARNAVNAASTRFRVPNLLNTAEM